MPPRQSPRARPAPRSAHLGIAAFFSVFLAVVVTARVAVSGDEERAAALDRVLEEMLFDRGVERAGLTAHTVQLAAAGGAVAPVEVPLPEGDNYARWSAGLPRAVEAADRTVLDAVETGTDPERPSALEIQLGRGGEVAHRLAVQDQAVFPREGEDAPRVALVFDDLGYTLSGLASELLELEVPVTFAVLPGLAHSEDFAVAARSRGHEVILHLPMEPLDRGRHDPGRHALDPALPREENRRRIRRHLEALSSYAGVSNHMGSRATAEASLMDLVMEEIRGRDASLFVLDSRTTPYSVVPERAREAGVSCAVNNLFLDGSDEYGTVAGIQAQRVAAVAKRRGAAIAIGHVRRDTIDAVRHALEGWQREGIRLVPLSDLMHR